MKKGMKELLIAETFIHMLLLIQRYIRGDINVVELTLPGLKEILKEIFELNQVNLI